MLAASIGCVWLGCVLAWQEDLSLRSCFCVVDGAAKLLFSVPSRHDAAFAVHLESFLPPHSHPLLYRGKNVFFVPDAASIARFDISVRVCGVSEFVLIDNNVWHCGVNFGPNCSISVNIIGAGGVDALQQDVRAILDDLQQQKQRVLDFHRDWTAGRVQQSEQDCRDDWNEAVKQLQKQVNIYNGQTSARLSPQTLRPPAAAPIAVLCCTEWRCPRVSV